MEAGGLLPRQSQQPGPPGPNQLQPQIVNSISSQQQLHQEQQLHQNIQLHQQQQMGQAPEILPRGNQVAAQVVERLRKRMELYRGRQKDAEPKYDRSFHGICEQGIQETLLLKQRFVDSSKAKRQPKKNDKKQNDTIVSTTLSNNIHVVQQQKFLKRTTDDLDSTGIKNEPGFGEPPVKLQCTQSSSASIGHAHVQQQQSNNSAPSGNNGGGAAPGGQPPPSHNAQGGASNNSGNGSAGGNTTSEDLSKFSVEIVQQFEFSTASSQAQQISTNVTVKALTNASVKSEHLNSSPPVKTEQSTTTTTASSNSSAQTGPNSGSGAGSGGPTTINTPSDIINSLVECKQEPDNDFDLEQCAAALEKDPCFPGFVVDFMNDEVGHEDALKDLISDISDFHPELNFRIPKDSDYEDKPLDGPNNGVNIKIEDDKERVHMQQSNQHHHPHHHHQQAQQQHQQQQQQQQQQQHQHQQQQGPMSAQYSPRANQMAYSGLDFKSEMNPAAQTLKQMAEQHQHKNQQLSGGGFNSSAAAAAAAVAAAARAPNARSPYAEFNQFSSVQSEYINSPQGSIGSQIPQNVNYHKNNGANSAPVKFQNQQSENMYIQQQRQGAPTQNNVPTNKSANILGSGGPTGPAGSGYKQQYSPYGSPGSMPNHGSPGYPLPSRISQGPNQGSNSQAGFNSSTPPRPPSGSGASNIQINQAQQLHINTAHPIQVSAGQHMQLSGELKPGNVSVAAHQGIYFNQQQQPQSQQQQGAPTNQNETYCSVSQSQTINFTQQSLRQRPAAGGVGATAASQQQARTHPGQQQSTQIQQQQHPSGGQQLSEQQIKFMQQNMMRAQQQQQRQQHLSSTLTGGIQVRPPPPEYPPPEYKATQAQAVHAGVGVGQQPRLSAPMRRVNQQPIPPSGPMMRPQMPQQTGTMHPTNNPMYIGSGGVNVGAGTGAVPGGMSAIGGMHQMQQKLVFPRTNNPRSPNINLGSADGLGNSNTSRASGQNWQQQQLFMQQQQQIQQQQHQGGFGGGSNIHINTTQMQHQQILRTQMSGPAMNNIPLHQQMVVPQQQQQQQQMNNQMGMQLQMSQTQTMNTVSANNANGSSMIPHQYSNSNPSVRGSMQSHVNSQQQQPLTDTSVNAADLANLDFLDNLPAGDTSNFNPQELLNSLDTQFNFDSML